VGEDIGAVLVRAIPSEFQQSGIPLPPLMSSTRKRSNAFALPGGPMYLNRGMIEAAKD
jgi:hypothetical protein